MTDREIQIRQQAYALTLCTIVFMIVYNLCTLYASNLSSVPSFIFDFERSIPFIPWTIIPYMAGRLFFCLVFFCCKSKEQLKTLTLRMLFVICIAGFCFVTVPLRFSFAKPEVPNALLNLPFSFLTQFDSPFNQSPSLHIAFAFVFWSVLKEVDKWRLFFMISLILVGISTLTTYQHHLVDILTGTVLAHLSFTVFPVRKNDSKYINSRIANYYFLAGWIFILGTMLLYRYSGFEAMIFFFPAMITFGVGFYYKKNNSNPLSVLLLTLRQNRRPSTKD